MATHRISCVGKGVLKELNNKSELDNVLYGYRLGEEAQDVVVDKYGNTMFGRIARQYQYSGVKLQLPPDEEPVDQYYIYHVTRNKCNSLMFTISFPALYKLKTDGSSTSGKCTFELTWRKVVYDANLAKWVAAAGTDGEWRAATTFEVSGETKSTLQYDHYLNFSADTKDYFQFRLLKVSEPTVSDDNDFRVEASSYLAQVVEFEHAELTYPGTALFGYRLLATDRISGQTPNSTVVVKGKKVRPVKDVYAHFVANNYSYDSATWKQIPLQYTANPADILYDLLTNSRYGLGKYLRIDQVDIESLVNVWNFAEELVDYIEVDPATGLETTMQEKRFALNLVLDKKYKAMDIIGKVCETCRLIPIWAGDKFKFIIDKKSGPVQLFTMANIVEDSFEETYTGLVDIPNQIECEFLDEDNDFERTTICGVDRERIDEPVKSKKVNLYGLTRKTRAKREIAYNMRKARAIKKTVNFEAGLDAIVCEPGDVIMFSHDTPLYGWSGEVKRTWTDTNGQRWMALEKPAKRWYGTYFDETTGLTKPLRFRLGVRQSFSTKVISVYEADSDPTWGEVDADGNGGQDIYELPISADVEVGSIYIFGVYDLESKPFRVTSITKGGDDNKVKITAIEYNESVYRDDNSIEIIDKNYSYLGLVGSYIGDGDGDPSELQPPKQDNSKYDVPPYVTDVNLDAGTILYGDTNATTIEVSFGQVRMPITSMAKVVAYEILYSDDDGVTWYVAGRTSSTKFNINGVKLGVKYYVLVKPYTQYDMTNNVEQSEYELNWSIGPLTAETPTDITAMTASTEAPLRVDLVVTFEAPVGFSHVEVYASQEPQGEYAIIGTTAGKTYSHSNLSAYSEWYYRARVVSKSGEKSNVYPPADQNGIYGKAGQMEFEDSVDLSWFVPELREDWARLDAYVYEKLPQVASNDFIYEEGIIDREVYACRIDIAEDSITSIVTTVEGHGTMIQQTADSIELLASDFISTNNWTQSQIYMMADGIELNSRKMSEVEGGLQAEIGRIDIAYNNIDLLVAKSTEVDGLFNDTWSRIDMTSEQIRLEVVNEVERLDGQIAAQWSAITQTQGQITLEVNDGIWAFANDPTGPIIQNRAYLDLQSDRINMLVEGAVGTDPETGGPIYLTSQVQQLKDRWAVQLKSGIADGPMTVFGGFGIGAQTDSDGNPVVGADGRFVSRFAVMADDFVFVTPPKLATGELPPGAVYDTNTGYYTFSPFSIGPDVNGDYCVMMNANVHVNGDLIVDGTIDGDKITENGVGISKIAAGVVRGIHNKTITWSGTGDMPASDPGAMMWVPCEAGDNVVVTVDMHTANKSSNKGVVQIWANIWMGAGTLQIGSDFSVAGGDDGKNRTVMEAATYTGLNPNAYYVPVEGHGFYAYLNHANANMETTARCVAIVYKNSTSEG